VNETGIANMGAMGAGGKDSVNYFEFRNVTKTFDERTVLNRVSFAVKRGETCVIMGRSGVGKSVALKHIMGFLRADSGQVFVAGEDVTKILPFP
jgi:ABC-type multidrug transport system ATPase subunit